MNHLEMGMDRETLQHLWHSVNKWGKTQQQRDEMFVVCYEAYHLKTQDKKINQATRQSYFAVLFRNACIDYLRMQSSRLKHEILISEMGEDWAEFRDIVSNVDNEMETEVYIKNFLNSLSDIDKELVEYLIEDTPYQKIADEMKIPLNTVKTRIHRCRIKWQKIPQLNCFGA